MDLNNTYTGLQKLFIDNYSDLPINEIANYINKNNLFCNKIISLSTMRLIASIVYCYPALLDQTIQILSLIEKINIDLDFFTVYDTNIEIVNRSMVIYILLCLSNHIKFGNINIKLTYDQLAFINPIYMSKFPNYIYYANLDDFNTIINVSNENKIKMRNKMHSCHPIVQSLIDDDFELFNEIISKNNININSSIPSSVFEIHPILTEAKPIQYAAFLGSVNCFKYLLLKTSSINFKKYNLMKFAIAGGNSEIIHIIENQCENFNIDFSSNQKLLDLAILYMRNDLIEYLLNNYELKINCFSYINCIYASNYEAFVLLQKLEKYEEKNENKTEINSIKELYKYYKFMISISDIIGSEYILSLRKDIMKSSNNDKKYDILNYIVNHKLIDDDFNDILKPISIVLNYLGEQVIKEIQSYYEHDDYDSYGLFYYYDDDDDPTDVFLKSINIYENTSKKGFHRIKYNRNVSHKKYNKNKIKYQQRLKKKCLKKNMILDIKEYFDENL